MTDVLSTVQKFPFILDEIATESGRTFAIVIDEAHSSQGEMSRLVFQAGC